MSTLEEIVRNRVRQVLAKSRMSHAEFAQKMDLDPTKLSKSLAGARRFTSFELVSIADLGNTTIDWLLGGKEDTEAVAARHVDGAVDVEPAIENALLRARTYAEVDSTLRRLVEMPPLPPLPDPPLDSEPAIAAGPLLAGRAFKMLFEADLEPEEVRKDPATAVEKVFGIHVAFEPFDDALDGLAFVADDFRLVLVNSKRSWSRQRFTLAHECGHIFSRDGVDAEGARIDRDVMQTWEGPRHRIEVRANAFAAAVLMPEQSVRERFANHDVDEESFARAVGAYLVSPSALAWRLVKLGLLNKGDARRYLRMTTVRAADLGGWIDEYYAMTVLHSSARRPSALTLHAVQAFNAGTISGRPLAALFNVPVETILTPPCADLAGEEPVFAP
ncbi:helix-turn-helix domain-containing protein [Actinomadura macra]|uniref:helix-turn-helix domain-containing protein n=1 Tax=Actinomadura macra TaxID=46164 RepID=UPI000832F0A9|nr:XRE family transcriptional regulator [Actinomadura macra]